MNDTRSHWFAVQAKDGSIRVFGPYTQSEVSDRRQAALSRAGPASRGSAIFKAADRGQAERNAKYFFPRDDAS